MTAVSNPVPLRIGMSRYRRLADCAGVMGNLRWKAIGTMCPWGRVSLEGEHFGRVLAEAVRAVAVATKPKTLSATARRPACLRTRVQQAMGAAAAVVLDRVRRLTG